MKKAIYASAVLLALVPMIASAQSRDIADFFDTTLIGIVNAITVLLVAVATLVFIWGIISYIAAGGDETKMKDAKRYIIFSIIGLALILGIWGVATFLVEGLGFDTVINTIPIPGGAITP